VEVACTEGTGRLILNRCERLFVKNMTQNDRRNLCFKYSIDIKHDQECEQKREETVQ
jgi:hypothetical protein